MSDIKSPNGREDVSVPEGGILAALPRSRPQRASPRRAAARNSTGVSAKATTPKAATPVNAPAAAAKPSVKRPATARATTKKAPTKQKPTSSAVKRRAAKPVVKPVDPPAPKQGYEPEEEFELGATVNPPNGVELVESVADIVGELANSGLVAGGRLLKDAFSLLRRP
jgi:hypothetical protein